jgi:pyruvate dehydrogenase E2 component (dihydrolipoamide acetyltransferase)
MSVADVLMPQMGESITEGTVTRWLKKPGDKIGKDEPLFEITTDKVDAEIPSPVAGTLEKILVGEGQTVGVHEVVARIEQAEGAVAAWEPAQPVAATPTASASAPPPSTPPPAATLAQSAPREASASGEPKTRIHSSPLVRRLASKNDVDLAHVHGTGPSGRITKNDLLAHVERQKSGAQPVTSPDPDAPTQVVAEATSQPPAPTPEPGEPGPREEVVPMTAMRGRFEARENIRLTYTPFFIRAVIEGLRRYPALNASISGDNVIYKKEIHMGIAVALEGGLIVPVIRNADEKSFLGLAMAVSEMAERARTKRLTVTDVANGTFTITNPGVYGAMFATPIINPPQVGIVGVGGVKKMPVVINDSIAIRSMVHLALSFDHRLIDGALADQFLLAVKHYLERWEENLYS